MDRTPPRLRVALSATPLLLADSLRALLADERSDVTLIVDPVGDTYDVAVVTPGGASIDAEVVIELDVDPAARGGGLLRRGGVEQRLDDIHAVVAAVHHLQPGPEPAV